MKAFAAAALAVAVSADRAMVGTNIGGWMVLEPWITPSMFYRFLGKTGDEVGMDQYTFCSALGAETGNAVLRDHWANWLTEDHISGLADREVEMVRMPIGDWTLKQYGAYVGCTDGADEYISWALDTFDKYGIKVLLDVHAVKGSQNGFDNSGLSNRTVWNDDGSFSHWEHAFGEWMGTWNNDEGRYESINQDNIDWALDTVDGLLNKWGNHPAVAALEPVNEPWWCSDLDTLKQFYRDVRNKMRDFNPDLKFVFHDSFHFDSTWDDLFEDDDIENVVMDTHQYFAWYGQHEDIGTYCDDYGGIMAHAVDVKYEVWVGEWSLATDVCATWLGGFNDANTAASRDCQRVECPYSYLLSEAVDFDRTAAAPGPYGTTGYPAGNEHAVIKEGMCPIDSDFYSSDDVMRLGQCTLDIFNWAVDGHFMWTFRNELEPRWEYVASYDAGWIKQESEALEITQ